MKVVFSFGTRPELIKIYPVIKYFEKNNINVFTFFTGQHDLLVNQNLKVMDILFNKTMRIEKKISLNQKISLIITNLEKYLLDVKPDYLFVQGDTLSALASAICANNLQIKIAYIESGLRTYNLFSPFPEESYRQIISRISHLNFCPTKIDKKNLLNEGIDSKKIFITGNTVIDSLKLFNKNILNESNKHIPYVIVTIHRRENFGKNISLFFNELIKLANKNKNYLFYFIEHPNPEIKNSRDYHLLRNNSNVIIKKPLSYIDFLSFLKSSFCIITDSGGLQEESTFFKVPALVYRDCTERIISIKLKMSYLIKIRSGDLTNKFNFIKKNRDKIFNNKNNLIYGNGNSSRKIFTILNKDFNKNA